MGSMSKRPRAPAPVQQKIIYYVPAPSAPTSGSSGGGGVSDPVPTDEEKQAKARVQNLLRRTRGQLGTVLTGFRGILALGNESTPRKTLLGE